jgi:hypothetical protein
VDLAALLNVFLDTLPRVEIRWSGRPRPAFRTCGTIGFGVAVIVAIFSAVAGHRSLLALAESIGIAVLSFFAWARGRRALTGVENLVLLEHVWFALLCVAAFLYWRGLPVSATLDPFCAGLAFFLAGGRAGCCLVGCCHGHPSSVGFCYPAGHAADGFSAHLVGIRLFPVQALEFIGLVAIGVSTAVAIPFAEPGHPTVWFLLSYSLIRFSLEEIRADERPFLWEMSLPRWMCLAEVTFALAWTHPTGWIAIAFVVIALGLHLGRSSSRRVLRVSHIEELRTILRNYQSREARTSPVAWATSQRVTVAVSPTLSQNLHVSLCLTSRSEDVPLLSKLAAHAFPQLDPESGLYSGFNTLHFALPQGHGSQAPDAQRVFQRLYRQLLTPVAAVRVLQTITPSPQPTPWYWRETSRRVD